MGRPLTNLPAITVYTQCNIFNCESILLNTYVKRRFYSSGIQYQATSPAITAQAMNPNREIGPK